ncbi:MAG TPA: hypothetical protein VN958_00045 [Chitinophagaceae bacterium]|nr:hypothetical protein [Chitinophagaceae bacterium]
MKFIAAIILTALLGYAAPLYFSWWSFAVTSFIVAIAVHQHPAKAFIAGFIGLSFLWGIHASIIDNANNHILSRRVAYILPLNGSSISLIWITAITGGLVSGFAALTGSFARSNLP